jgi:hypothetical protein
MLNIWMWRVDNTLWQHSALGCWPPALALSAKFAFAVDGCHTGILSDDVVQIPGLANE